MNKLVGESLNGNQTTHPTRLNYFIYFKQTEIDFFILVSLTLSIFS